MELHFAPAASKHGISHERAAYVVEHCGLPFDGEDGDSVTMYLGDDWNGVPLEVGVVQRGGEVVVVHAMSLRPKFRAMYEETVPWRL